MQGLEENNLSGVASAVLELGMRPINSSRASYLLLAKVSRRLWTPIAPPSCHGFGYQIGEPPDARLVDVVWDYDAGECEPR
jgi:hypothetical protein